jgi:hypothetical protein
MATEPPPYSKSSVSSNGKLAYEGMLMLENPTQKFRLEDPDGTPYDPAARLEQAHSSERYAALNPLFSPPLLYGEQAVSLTSRPPVNTLALPVV